MQASLPEALDLTPPRFAEGLADWSRGDGTPGSASCEDWDAARLVTGDPDFGDCLELRKVEQEQRLRYMGELPLRPGATVELRLRLKALRGPVPRVCAAAWPGGFGACALPDLPARGPHRTLPADGAPIELRLVLSRTAGAAVDLVWDRRALFAHVGLDLVGPCGGVVRIADVEAREIAVPALPGFSGA